MNSVMATLRVSRAECAVPVHPSGAASTRSSIATAIRAPLPEHFGRGERRPWRRRGTFPPPTRPAVSVAPRALPAALSTIVPPVSSFTSPSPGLAAGIIANTVVYILGNRVLLKGLSLDGFVSSYFLGCVSYAAFGPVGYVIVCLYFLIGSYVTKLKMDVKLKEGTAEARGGRRGIGSVLGSGVAGMACAVLALILTGYPSYVPGTSGEHVGPLADNLFHTLQVGFAASFCSKLSDTVSSEIGKAYGKTTYLATSFQKVPRGTEGAVSVEGTLAGVVASLVLGVCAAAGGLLDGTGLVCVIAASFVANYFESLLGAGIQRGGGVRWLTNDVVNMLQISVASVVAMSLFYRGAL